MLEIYLVIISAAVGAILGFGLSLSVFFIQKRVSDYSKKAKAAISLRFEMNVNWEIMTTYKLPFHPLDNVIFGIISSGDLRYLDKELLDFILIYYRELSHHKMHDLKISKNFFEKSYPMYYTAFRNLRNELNKEKVRKKLTSRKKLRSEQI